MSGDNLYDTLPPTSAVEEAASLFRISSRPIRLKILRALSVAGEVDTKKLASELGEFDLALLYQHLKELSARSLIVQRTVGKHNTYALAKAGLTILEAFVAICEGLADRASERTILPQRVEFSKGVTNPTEWNQPSSQLIDAATKLNHAGNPLRLGILLALAGPELNAGQIFEALGRYPRGRVNHHLGVLSQGGLIDSRHHGLSPAYRLTPAGRSLVNVVKATTSLASHDFGEFTLLPKTTCPESGQFAAPTLEDRFASMFSTFADPVRLRILNLLAARDAVCFCHLQETLQLPRRSLQEVLNGFKRTGLILEKKDNVWAYYRPSPATDVLFRSLVENIETGLMGVELFKADWDRLRGLDPCPPSARGGSVSKARAPRSSRGHARKE